MRKKRVLIILVCAVLVTGLLWVLAYTPWLTGERLSILCEEEGAPPVYTVLYGNWLLEQFELTNADEDGETVAPKRVKSHRLGMFQYMSISRYIQDVLDNSASENHEAAAVSGGRTYKIEIDGKAYDYNGGDPYMEALLEQVFQYFP